VVNKPFCSLQKLNDYTPPWLGAVKIFSPTNLRLPITFPSSLPLHSGEALFIYLFNLVYRPSAVVAMLTKTKTKTII
jgi:hypothetical protein